MQSEQHKFFSLLISIQSPWIQCRLNFDLIIVCSMQINGFIFEIDLPYNTPVPVAGFTDRPYSLQIFIGHLASQWQMALM